MPTPVVYLFHGRGVVATPGYSVFILPWAGYKSESGWASRLQGSGFLGGGLSFSDANQNNSISWDIWLDAGTYKFALVYRKATDGGIFHVQLDAVDKGTIDSYNGSTTENNYSEVTGIAVTAGLYTFTLKMASKNASSTNYGGRVNSAAWIRTGA